MWNNFVVDELPESTSNNQGTTISESHATFYMKHKILEGKILVN